VRTRLNVRDSDTVLVLHLADVALSPGALLTVEFAEELGRPLLVARADAPKTVTRWLAALPSGSTLDVAGPRESEDPGLYAAARRMLLELWAR
jgi:hypothetical protein